MPSSLRDSCLTIAACVLALAITLLIAVGSALAQESPPPAPRAVVPPEIQDFPRNMVVVVDTSQSMDGDPFRHALDVFGLLTDHGVDEWQLGVVAFGGTGKRWPGDGNGWAAMPSADAIDQARGWLRDVDCRASTLAWTGIELATRDVPEGGLLVVIVSDGHWQDGAIVQGCLPGRLSPRLAVATYSVGEPLDPAQAWPRPIMLTIGRMGRGGAWR